MQPSPDLTRFQLVQFNDELLNEQLTSVLKRLPNVFRGKAFDVGCGFSTSYQRVLLKLFQSVELIEINEKAIKLIEKFKEEFCNLYPMSNKELILHAKPVQQWQPEIGDP